MPPSSFHRNLQAWYGNLASDIFLVNGLRGKKSKVCTFLPSSNETRKGIISWMNRTILMTYIEASLMLLVLVEYYLLFNVRMPSLLIYHGKSCRININ